MKRYFDRMIADICRLIAVPSVYAEDDGFLFGKSIDLCLDTALDIMRCLGFTVYKPADGAYAWAELGEGELFGVLGHMDVVNARREDGWEHDPFVPEIRGGFLCGRGAQDDKGPVVTAAYALRSLLDDGYRLKRRVRFIFGADEETLWRSIRLYAQREEIPAMGFTPDSTFPLTYAEKGLLQVLITSPEPAPFSYEGGDSFNAVSSRAVCAGNPALAAELTRLGYAYRHDGERLVVEGVTAHAKNPWKGVSANLRLLEAARNIGLRDGAIDFACQALNGKFRFEGFSAEDLSDFSGPVTVNLGKMRGGPEGTEFSVDLRLPVGCSKERVMALLAARTAEYGLNVREFDWLRPIHVPLESEMVQNLLGAYRSVTGDRTTEPYISAGATYARAFDNCVAFGANMPDAPTSEHQPNERVRLDNLLRAGEVYRTAFRACVME
jgi:succinyl-diaminopimelate desuccinylase